MKVAPLVASITAFAFLAAIPALAAPSGNYDGNVGKASLSMDVAVKGGKITKIKSFAWDGLKCGQDKFTGGLSKKVKVSDDSFNSRQPVGGVSVSLKLHLKGHFVNDDKKAKGTLSIKGACSTGKKSWSATAQ
jgi:hypothetical protein